MTTNLTAAEALRRAESATFAIGGADGDGAPDSPAFVVGAATSIIDMIEERYTSIPNLLAAAREAVEAQAAERLAVRTNAPDVIRQATVARAQESALKLQRAASAISNDGRWRNVVEALTTYSAVLREAATAAEATSRHELA